MTIKEALNLNEKFKKVVEDLHTLYWYKNPRLYKWIQYNKSLEYIKLDIKYSNIDIR